MAVRVVTAALLSHALRLRLTTCAGVLIVLVTFVHFFFCGSYYYAHIPREFVFGDLNKQVNRQLELSKTKPQCDYSYILASRKTVHSWEDHIPRNYNDMSLDGLVNGSFVPAQCNPLLSVAVIVPYRNREEQRNIFLSYMHNFLRKQNIHYKQVNRLLHTYTIVCIYSQ